MKINSVQLKNFRNHQNSLLNVGQINVITGHNNSGKSSIKGAIQFALTGDSEWTSSGKENKNLIQNGFKGASAIVDIDGFGTIERRITPSSNTLKVNNTTIPNKELQDDLKDLFNLDIDPIKYIIDSDKFFTLSADKQKDFMFKTLGVNLNKNTIIQFLEEPDDSSLKKIESMLKSKYFDNVDIEDFDKIYKDLYAERKLEKKEKAKLENEYNSLVLEDKPSINIEELQKQSEQINDEKNTILKQITNLQAKEENYNTLKKYLDNISNEISTTKAQLKIDITEIDKTKKEIETLSEQYVKYNGLLIKNKTAENVLIEQNKNLQQMISNLSGNKCPLSDKLICKTDKSLLKNEIQQNIDKNLKNINIAQANVTKLENCVNKIVEKKNLLNEQINICNNLINLNKKEEQYKEDLNKNNYKKDNTENIEVLNKKIEIANEKLNTIIENKNKYNTWLEKVNRKSLLEKNINKKSDYINILDYLIEEFSPKGVKSRILKKVISPIEEQCNINLNILTNGRYKLIFSFENNFEILINKEGNIIPVQCLSNSEKLRISVIIQDAINKTTGFNILIIDNVEILDKENETLFIDLIEQIKDEYENIFIISSNPIAIKQATNFVVSEGQIREVVC